MLSDEKPISTLGQFFPLDASMQKLFRTQGYLWVFLRLCRLLEAFFLASKQLRMLHQPGHMGIIIFSPTSAHPPFLHQHWKSNLSKIISLHLIKKPLGTGTFFARLVAQSVMSATDKLGHWDVRYMACLPQILVWGSGLASTLCPRMLACHHSWCW